MDAIRDLARRLLAQHEELVSEVADALRKAKDEAPKEPGFFDRIGNFINGMKNLASSAWKWVQKHADLIAKFGDIMSKISTALAVLAIVTAPFEPVGTIFAGAAGLTSLTALAAHGVAKAAGAKVGWGSISLDALGTLPFVRGMAQGAKVATGAETAHSVIKAEGVVGRLDTGIEQAYQNFRKGQPIGTKGLNFVADKLTDKGIIDPLSVGGRALDASIKGGASVAGEVYHHLTGPGGPLPSASQTFSSRVVARGAA